MSRFLWLAALAFGLSSLLSAQTQQPVLAPHRPIPPRLPHPKSWHDPAVQGSMVGGLWMTDANFKSSIYLKNIVETDPVTVTPILYLANGTKYTLPDVKLEAGGTAIVDINAGLEAQGISSYATLSGYVEIQYTWPWDPICADHTKSGQRTQCDLQLRSPAIQTLRHSGAGLPQSRPL